MTAMRGLTALGANQALDAVFGSGTPTTWFVALLQSVTGDSGSGEPTINTNNYSRVSMTNNATNFPAASGGSKTVGVDIVFPTSSGAWAAGASLACIGFYDAASSGNLKAWATLNVPAVVNGTGITVKLLYANSDCVISITEATT